MSAPFSSTSIRKVNTMFRIALAALLLLPGVAVAETPNEAGATVTTTAALLIPSGTKKYLAIQVKNGDAIDCSFTSSAPTVGGTSSFTMEGTWTWGLTSFIPTSELWCISAGSVVVHAEWK